MIGRGWRRASRPGFETAETAIPFSKLPCQNCGDAAEGNYCRICGQHKIDHRASVLSLLSDTVEDFSLTSELPRTLKALLLRPGFLTREFSAGRVARYIPPVRLYLAASLVFFLTLQLVSRRDVAPNMAATEAVPAAGAPAAGTVAGSTATAAGSATGAAATPARADVKPKSPKKSKKITLAGTPFPWLNAKITEATARLEKLPPGEAQRRIKDFMIQRAPIMMFMLLPLFALLTKLFFWGSRKYYTEHLVFALHTHAVTFVAYTLLLLFPGDGSWKYPALALIWGVVFYQLFAMKRVFEQGWVRTVLKWATIGVTYFALFVFALIAEVIAALLVV